MNLIITVIMDKCETMFPDLNFNIREIGDGSSLITIKPKNQKLYYRSIDNFSFGVRVIIEYEMFIFWTLHIENIAYISDPNSVNYIISTIYDLYQNSKKTHDYNTESRLMLDAARKRLGLD